tara:strand:+ start:2019 stop:2696 length:678 start_codon:yes stop_codon:yes gene_type:complete
MNIKKSLIFYLIFIFIFFLIFFSDLAKEDFLFFLNYMEILKEKNYVLLIFFLVCISVTISLIGFCIPVLFVNGAILGGIWGAFISLISLTLGSYIFFLINKKNFSEKIFNLYEKKFNKLSRFINKNILISLIFIRAFGFGMPFVAHNLLPVFLKANKRTFLISAFFGLMPLTAQSFFASGIVEYLTNENQYLKNIFFQKNIIIPVVIFLFLLIASFILKYKYLKK